MESKDDLMRRAAVYVLFSASGAGKLNSNISVREGDNTAASFSRAAGRFKDEPRFRRGTAVAEDSGRGRGGGM